VELEVVVIVSPCGSLLGGTCLTPASMAALYESLDCLELVRGSMSCWCLPGAVYVPFFGCLRGIVLVFAIDNLGV